MVKESDLISNETRIEVSDTGRQGTYMYAYTTDVGGFLVHTMWAEFDDNKGYEEEIYLGEFKILGESNG